MSRHILDESKIHASIRQTIHSNHRDIVEEVIQAVRENTVVVVGMGQNPHCKKARQFLDGKGIKFKYLEYGNYLNTWRRRNALKMWTGWPTFPMVFIRGTFVGGASDLKRLSETGELDKLLKAG